MEFYMKPRTTTRLYISGDSLDLEEITVLLGVTPTDIHRKEDARAVIKEMDLAADTWGYTIPRAECTSVSERIGALEAVFGDRTGQISAVRERYAANVSVELSLHAVIGDEPDLTLTRGDLAFLGSMGAEFGIDPYPYYPDETDDLPPVGEGA